MTRFAIAATALLALLVAAVLGGAAWLWFKQERLLFAPDVLPPQTRLAPEADISEHTLEVPGARLSALHLQQTHAKGVVFFLHGNAGNLQTWFTNAAFYRQAGFDLYMLDYRGFGKSTGQIQSEAQLRADVRAAWNQVARQYIGKKIVLYGRSLGSGLAAGLAAELALEGAAQLPNLTVLVSPYSSMVALADQHFAWVPHFLLRYPLRTDQLIGHIRGPVLLFHGDQDALIPPAHSELLARLAVQGQRQLVVGAAHNDVHEFQAYRDAFRAALDAL